MIGSGIPGGATILSLVANTSITLSATATASATVTLSVITSPFCPLNVIVTYVALATASLVQARWQDSWLLGMHDFVAHYCTLWMRSDGDVYSSPGQAAAAGLARGITVSKGTGPVSQGIQPIQGLESWGAWNETEYGIRFATTAKIVGSGCMLLW